MSDKNIHFVKGMNVRTIKTKYGELLNCGIKVEDFFCDENKVSAEGWVNFTIKKGKSGNWYAEVRKNKGGQDE